MKAELTQKAVLVVDDTPENIDLLVALLKDKYTVKAARNGPVALKICQSPNPPDLVLLDINMPGMDGYEVCSTLKADPARSSIPVVYLSGEDCSSVKLRETGAQASLAKPVDPVQLMQVIEDILIE